MHIDLRSFAVVPQNTLLFWQTSDPVADKLVDMNARLDELLLQLGELQVYMPDVDVKTQA